MAKLGTGGVDGVEGGSGVGCELSTRVCASRTGCEGDSASTVSSCTSLETESARRLSVRPWQVDSERNGEKRDGWRGGVGIEAAGEEAMAADKDAVRLGGAAHARALVSWAARSEVSCEERVAICAAWSSLVRRSS